MRSHDLRIKFHLTKHHCRRSLLFWCFRKKTFDDPSGGKSCCFQPVFKLLKKKKTTNKQKKKKKKRRLSSHSLLRWELVEVELGESAPVLALWRRCRKPKMFLSFTSLISLCLRTRRLIAVWWNPSWRLTALKDINSCPMHSMYLPYLRFWQSPLRHVRIQYSQTSIARTPIARLPWLIRTRFWVPTKFFR